MKKIIFLLLFTFTMFSSLYCDEISDLFDEAKEEYEQDNVTESLERVKELENLLTALQSKSQNTVYEEPLYSKLKTFPGRYEGKRITLKDITIKPSELGDQVNGYYGITVSNLQGYDSILPYSFYDEKALIFMVSENLLDQLLEITPSGRYGYFNLYTDEIYVYTIQKGHSSKSFYFAEIVKLEELSYDPRSRSTTPTGNVYYK